MDTQRWRTENNDLICYKLHDLLCSMQTSFFPCDSAENSRMQAPLGKILVFVHYSISSMQILSV